MPSKRTKREAPSDVESAISSFQAAKDKAYYDEATDTANSKKYYRSINARADGKALFRSLHKLVRESHTHELAYQPSLYLYPWVDLRPDLSLQSIYSSKAMNATEIIAADFKNAEYWNEVGKMAALSPLAPTVIAAQIALTASSAIVNCEHVVCQSWFDYDKTMKGDLHHLFSCDPQSNSYRNNHTLASVPNPVSIMQEAGSLGGGGFEPDAGRGAAARATLYVLTRYPKKVSQYTPEKLQDLLRWNREDPPGLYEKHRNQAIEGLQGNRNPFIDHPEWADKLDFNLGIRLHPSNSGQKKH